MVTAVVRSDSRNTWNFDGVHRDLIIVLVGIFSPLDFAFLLFPLLVGYILIRNSLT